MGRWAIPPATDSAGASPTERATDMAAQQITLTFHTYREHTVVTIVSRETSGHVESRKRSPGLDLTLGLEDLQEMRDDEVLSALVSALNARLQ